MPSAWRTRPLSLNQSCPCGYLGASHRACRCAPEQVARYQARLSGPLLDRIDLQVEVPALAADLLLQAGAGEASAPIRLRCQAARELAVQRQGKSNHALAGQDIDQQLHLDDTARQFLSAAAARLGWSGRAVHRTLKVARTIADLVGTATIQLSHVAEAMQYRRCLQTV